MNLDIATASLRAQLGVLWGLLLLAVLVCFFFAMRLVQTREQMRKSMSRESQATQYETTLRIEFEALREKQLEIETELAAALREGRRLSAIRHKAERRLIEQNAEIEALRKERDWLKRFVDHVDT